MENKIRVKSSNEYVLEVNEQGDTITFDLLDTSLTSRLMRTFERIDAVTEEYKEKAKAIDNSPLEVAYESVCGNDTVTITRKDLDGEKLLNELFMKMREIMDGFFGIGACQKIFGDKNWATMFEDLAEQLEPHFKKMGIKADNLRQSAAKKYSPDIRSKRVLK